MQIDLDSDSDFYAFVKSKLPDNFKIISEPSPAYFSEYLFHYKLMYNDCEYFEIKGDFREIEEGYLIKLASSILQNTINVNCQ